jgi:hypothetical protein
VRWGEFAAVEPDLAAAGSALFGVFTVGYLATLRPDGAPRIHPVTVTVHDGGLYVFTLAGSRKGEDLARDPRYALHAFPRAWSDAGWDDEEFAVGGRATAIDDGLRRARIAAVHNDSVADGDRLFELHVDRAFHKSRVAGRVVNCGWREDR